MLCPKESSEVADNEVIHDSPEHMQSTSLSGRPSRELAPHGTRARDRYSVCVCDTYVWATIPRTGIAGGHPENWHRARTCDGYSVCVIRTYGRPSRELVYFRSGGLGHGQADLSSPLLQFKVCEFAVCIKAFGA